MGRTDKLRARLDGLTAEFRELLAVEFAVVAEGRFSKYLYSRDRGFGHGRSRRTEQSARLDTLEEDIAALEEKLGVDRSISPIRYVDQFHTAREAAGSAWWEGHGVATARRLLAALHSSASVSPHY